MISQPKPGFEKDIRQIEKNLPRSTIIFTQGLEQEKAMEKFPQTHKVFVENFIRQKIESAPLPKLSSIQPQKQITPQSTVNEIKTTLEDVVEIAFKSGVAPASQVAKSLGPYFVDLFHDTLVEEFYDELVRRGKLSKK